VAIMEFPKLKSEASLTRADSRDTGMPGRARGAPSRMSAVLDVARTLLVLSFIGCGIVMLRLLLVLARSAIGH
jgi:hypothetical protein